MTETTGPHPVVGYFSAENKNSQTKYSLFLDFLLVVLEGKEERGNSLDLGVYFFATIIFFPKQIWRQMRHSCA